MSILSENMKFQLKKVAILGVLSVTLFFGSFYLVNFIDIKPAPKKVSEIKSTQNLLADNVELQKRANGDNINLAAFEDWAKINNLGGNDVYDSDADKDGLANYLEYIHGTDPNNADTDGDTFSDSTEIANGYDPDSKGEAMTTVYVKIDKMGVDAPMVWSKTDVEAKMLSDLENGVTHYLKTAAPGQNGNMVVSGHSSNYIWAKGNYNYIFKNLNDLEKGDTVRIKTVQKNGRIIEYKYIINDKFITAADDEKIFADSENPTLTLSTCWPIGTNLKRIIVKGELVK